MLAQYRRIARERGSKLLSTQCISNNDKLTWRCKHGHAWSASPSNILGGKWCPKCRGRMPAEEQLALFAKIAHERGGKLLSATYAGSDTPLLWSCAQGHSWPALSGSVKRGSWCPKCRGRYSKEEAHAIYSQIARDRGGELLSKECLTTTDKLTWLCHRGHVWQTCPIHVKGGTWCPQCAILDRCGPKAAQKYLVPTGQRDDAVPQARQVRRRKVAAKQG